MNRDDIIRSFLDLHPDTPLDGDNRYAIRLGTISRMLEAGAAAEREECAKLCLKTEPFYGVMFAEAIRARGNHEDS